MSPFTITSCSSITRDTNLGENLENPVNYPIEPINIYSYDSHIYKQMPRININITAGINFAIEHKDIY